MTYLPVVVLVIGSVIIAGVLIVVALLLGKLMQKRDERVKIKDILKRHVCVRM